MENKRYFLNQFKIPASLLNANFETLLRLFLINKYVLYLANSKKCQR